MNTASPSPALVLIATEEAKALLPQEANAARARLSLAGHDSISASTIASNQVLRSTLRKTRDSGGRLHLFGLVSDGGIHCSLAHLFAVIEAAKAATVRVVVHAFLDGIDVATGTAAKYVSELEAKLEGGVGRIGTVSGRTFGMPPEGRWERVEKLYRALMADNVDRVDSALQGIQQACMFGVPEQFAAPFVVFDYPGVSRVDTGLHLHFGADGASDLTQALTAREFTRFSRKGRRAPFEDRFTCMIPYESGLSLPSLFPRAPDPTELPLELLDAAGRPTLVCNTGTAPQIAQAAVDAVRSGKYAFILADLASPENSTRSRSEAMNAAASELGLTAHGAGAAVMALGSRDATNSVPFVYLAAGARRAGLREHGQLCDLAPTLLECLQVQRPEDLEGTSLLVG